MSSCLTSQKPEIAYPCLWQYKVIGTARSEILNAVRAVIGDQDHSIGDSNQSSGGKYISLNVELEVDSETMRNRVFMALQSHSALRMVI